MTNGEQWLMSRPSFVSLSVTAPSLRGVRQGGKVTHLHQEVVAQISGQRFPNIHFPPTHPLLPLRKYPDLPSLPQCFWQWFSQLPGESDAQARHSGFVGLEWN